MTKVNIVDDLTALEAVPADDDYVVLIDKSAGQVKSVTTLNLIKVTGKQTYLVDASEIDQGAAGEGKSVKDYVDAIGTSKSATLLFTHNGTGNTTTYTFSTNETIPSNIKVIIENGAILDGSSTLTINKFSDPGPIQCFGSSITISFGSGAVKELSPEWWGIDGTADETEIMKAYTSLPTDGGLILLQNKVYVLTTAIQILKNDVTIKGQGHSTYLEQTGAGENVIEIGDASTPIYRWTLQDFGVAGRSGTGDGLFLARAHRGLASNIFCPGMGGSFIHLEWCVLNTFINPYCNYGTAKPPGLGTMVSPTHGIRIEKGVQSSQANTFINPIMEGIDTAPGIGILINICNYNTFIGGTSESNTVGVKIDGAGGNNTFIGIDLESNDTDIEDNRGKGTIWLNCFLEGTGEYTQIDGELNAHTKFSLGGKSRVHGDNPPTSLAHIVGEICYHDDVRVGDPSGWICTTAGTPGTWHPFGTLPGSQEKTEDYETTAALSGTTYSNVGAIATVTITLPPATEHLKYRLIRVAAEDFRGQPDGSEDIRGGGAGKYLQLDNGGDSVTLECIDAGSWEITSQVGTPSFEA